MGCSSQASSEQLTDWTLTIIEFSDNTIRCELRGSSSSRDLSAGLFDWLELVKGLSGDLVSSSGLRGSHFEGI